MVLTSRPSLLLAAAALAAPSSVYSYSIKPTPPRSQPPKSARPAWNHRSSRQQQSSTTPLRAYTVADNHRKNPWSALLDFPKSFADLAGYAAQFAGEAEDSLFSFEGGGAAKPATRPYMPNLEVEAAITETDVHLNSQVYSETIKTYDYKVKSLEEKNALLEEGLKALTVTLEQQGHQLQEIKQKNKDAAAAKKLEGDNEMLRQRLRAVELELSEVAFESRKVVPAPPRATVENTVVIAHMADDKDSSSAEEVYANTVNHAKLLSPKAPTAPVPLHIHQQRQSVSASTVNHAKLLSPKAPSAPVPPHIHHQRELEQLQLQMEEYKQERSSVRKLFGLGIRRGMNKVGKALNLCSPGYNLMLWGELRGHGKVLV